MSEVMNTLRSGVATLTEAFTEVEDELESGVYAVMQPALKQVQDNLTSAAVSLDNFAQVQRIMEAMGKSDEPIAVHFVDAIIERLQPRPVEEAPRPVRAPRGRREAPQEPPRVVNRMPDPFARAFRMATAPQVQANPAPWRAMPGPAPEAGMRIVDDVMDMEPLDMLRAMTQNGQAGAA